ncbi:hypothetical protein PV08_08945 [Exophiala spinifera]|uniref:ABM domain-containing protein n=1 Tax=Exophiala spinifera TaxID=91928 RepID=A0A0D2BR76_9EURO|nr:uncharacterized protein PV08_08945 [Exophiala spinifera]KIW13754.1 hypothetical protein PV08_08945 [Exophiala spinifera]
MSTIRRRVVHQRAGEIQCPLPEPLSGAGSGGISLGGQISEAGKGVTEAERLVGRQHLPTDCHDRTVIYNVHPLTTKANSPKRRQAQDCNMASAQNALQLIIVPHRPVHTENEINKDLAPSLNILQRARGLKALWRGKKHEDRHTQVALILWESLAASHAFFTSPEYADFHQAIQPAMNGRRIEWTNHVLIDPTGLNDKTHLLNALDSPAIEVALTKVVEGGVSGYYSQFRKIVVKILDEDPGCEGHFIGPLIENPQDQLLLINWQSVDAHHEEFEKKPTFRACIDGLQDYYAVFVIPWHIVDLKLVHGNP